MSETLEEVKAQRALYVKWNTDAHMVINGLERQRDQAEAREKALEARIDELKAEIAVLEATVRRLQGGYEQGESL